jgi:hypothetical protein
VLLLLLLLLSGDAIELAPGLFAIIDIGRVCVVNPPFLGEEDAMAGPFSSPSRDERALALADSRALLALEAELSM